MISDTKQLLKQGFRDDLSHHTGVFICVCPVGLRMNLAKHCLTSAADVWKLLQNAPGSIVRVVWGVRPQTGAAPPPQPSPGVLFSRFWCKQHNFMGEHLPTGGSSQGLRASCASVGLHRGVVFGSPTHSRLIGRPRPPTSIEQRLEGWSRGGGQEASRPLSATPSVAQMCLGAPRISSDASRSACCMGAPCVLLSRADASEGSVLHGCSPDSEPGGCCSEAESVISGSDVDEKPCNPHCSHGRHEHITLGCDADRRCDRHSLRLRVRLGGLGRPA